MKTPSNGNGPRPRGSHPAERHIHEIAQLEASALQQRSMIQRIVDSVARFSGSILFIVAHVVWFVAWIWMNTGKIPWIPVFDPFPYMLLTLIVSLEAIFLATFVLMSQNRMSRQADQRAHLDLQINLLAELEATKTLQMVQTICKHLGLEKEANDREVLDLIKKTKVEKLVRGLKKHLPNI